MEYSSFLFERGDSNNDNNIDFLFENNSLFENDKTTSELLLPEALFSDFSNKKKNRDSEFSAIAKYLPKKKSYNVLSLPFEYAFEREFFKRFRVPLNVYVSERNFSTKQAKRFISDTGNKVKVPVKYYKKHNVILPKKTTSVADFIGGNLSYADVNFSKFHVVQKNEAAPEGFDIIDLDYTASVNTQNFSEAAAMFHEHLAKGGLLFLTFSLSQYRNMHMTNRKIATSIDSSPEDDVISKFTPTQLKSKKLSANNNLNKVVGDMEKYKKYGLISKEDLLDKLRNMGINILAMFRSSFGVPPIYFNIYKGGYSSSGKIMIRMVFKK